ncbi:DNA cytosine methyltransferase [Kineosporia sp. R_H_3]|uniref:DNA cytosine methyltransferase n=1 Tax=Kineosporia sp. R_H_3 TaxID=1961848 RepID=UPI000B4C0216|nr:DNA cytosine methyltransferase [Kineosporia sp. R_H_3]
MARVYRIIDLFAGCGGLTQGFVQTGRFVPVGAVELDKNAAATYRANFGDHMFNGDIADWLRAGNLPAADVVVGGPPCQGFSNLGTRWNRDPRNALWNRYVETIQRVRPVAFVLENVPDFLRSGQFAALSRETRPTGRLSGYDLVHDVLDASAFGVAQKRRRALVIGRLRQLPEIGMPEATHGEPATLADVLHGVRPRVTETSLPRPHGPYLTTELHLTRNVTDLSRRRFEAIPAGGNRFDIPPDLLPACWVKHTTGSGDVMGRLRWEQPSVTIRTEFYKPEKGRYLHPTENRPITHLEAALLQGFPPGFLWHGSKTAIGRQIGNAVPVPLARAIAEHLAASLDRHVLAGDAEAEDVA